MGYDVTRFKCKIDEEFLCSICTMVFENATQTPCDHAFCHTCISEWLIVNQICPVDRQPLSNEDLKPSGRLLRNLVNKLEIKCDFHPVGCHTVVKLEFLPDHLSTCKYNPNLEVLCDKGCNSKVKRSEYEMKDCFTHLVDRVNRQNLEITDLKERLSNQEEESRLLNSKIESLSRRIEELTVNRQGFTTTTTVSNHLDILLNRSNKWQLLRNIQYDEPNTLQTDDKRYFGFAQSLYSLDPQISSFKVEILGMDANINGFDSWIGIGLTGTEPDLSDGMGNYPGSVSYSASRIIRFHLGNHEKEENVGPHWKVGDIIELRVKFPNEFNRQASVCFSRNGHLIREKRVRLEPDEMFPTIRMKGHDMKVKFFPLFNG